MSEHIGTIVDEGLCCSCGTCVAVCPVDAIRMVETPSGYLFASVDPDVCNGCDLCRRICPGAGLATNLMPPEIDPFKGTCLVAFTAKTTDKAILKNAQSGGAVSALLCFLLDQRLIEQALATSMPDDGSLRPTPGFVRTRDEVLHSQGSKYCPVALNSVLAHSNDVDYSQTAIVGLPCHIEGIRNAQTKSVIKNNPLLIGLVCGQILSYRAIDYLIAKAGVDADNVSMFRFRDKGWHGWPGDVRLQTSNGDACWLDRNSRMLAKDTFTPLRCRLCFDKMNILSDIVAGDAWGFEEDGDGRSILLARSERGKDILEHAGAVGVIELQPVSAEDVYRGQGLEKKRRDWTAFTQNRKAAGHLVPDFHIGQKHFVELNQVAIERASRELLWADQLRHAASPQQALKLAEQRLRWERLLRACRKPIIRIFHLLRRAAKIALNRVQNARQ